MKKPRRQKMLLKFHAGKKKTFCFFMLLPSCRVRDSVFMGSLMPQNVEFDILVGKEKNIYLKDRSLVLIPRTGEYQANIK